MLLEATKVTFASTNFIVVSAYEVTTIDNTLWLSIHLYVVQGWKRILILLCVENVKVFAMSNNGFRLMVNGLLKFGGLRLVEMVIGKLVGMGCDKSNVFQGHQMGMTL